MATSGVMVHGQLVDPDGNKITSGRIRASDSGTPIASVSTKIRGGSTFAATTPIARVPSISFT